MSSTEPLLEIPRERLVETNSSVVSFDTLNPPGDSREIVDWIESNPADPGPETERVATDRTKPFAGDAAR